jgi:molecular chaperone DnaK (HSP70)
MSDASTPAIVGIDLGTTYSCIAYVDDTGRPVVLKNSEGHNVTPSVVFFESEDNVPVGRTAKDAMKTDHDKVVAFMKRNMGKPNATYQINGRSYRPEEVSAYVLRRLVNDASEALQRPVTEAVITVPAYFGENERAATEQAGVIAGLKVRSIINEPTAAAICYGVDQKQEGTVLVYDLGGGTFDVTMIAVKQGKIDVVCTDGDYELGGKNWDEQLLNYLVSQWAEEKGRVDYELDNEETINELRLLAEDTKQKLTFCNEATALVLIDGERARVKVAREKFDELTANLLQQTIELTNKALQAAQDKGVGNYDKILLVGGSTRMPQVRERLEREYGKEIVLFDPDESVAKGAALFAQQLLLKDQVEKEVKERLGDGKPASEAERKKAEEGAFKEVAKQWALPAAKVEQLVKMKITPVTSKAFGVVALNESEQEEVVFLINRNVELPTGEKTLPFFTVSQNQRTADVRIMEGEVETATDPSMCNQIGQAALNLPAGLPRGAPIEVTFRINEQGMLEGFGKELSQGGTVAFSIERQGAVMNQEEVAEARSQLGKVQIT